MDVEKIKKLQAQAKANKGGAKGFRKPVRATGTSESDDKKLSLALKKLGVQPIQGVEEVNMFQDNGNVLHFGAPKVHAAVPSNTYAIYGNGQDKDMAELVPGILNQLGPDSLASLKRMAESYNAAQAAQAGKGAAAEPDDDDVPDLVENFDVDEKAGDAPATSSLEELE